MNCGRVGRCSLVLFLLLVIAQSAKSQDWDDWSQIYHDGDIAVDVKFKIEPNGCSESKKNLIAYRVTGTLNTFSDYLIWQTDYVDCNGKLYFQEHSLNISTGNDLSGGNAKAYGDTWTDPSDEFYAKSIVRKFYNMHRNSSPSRNSGPQIPKFSTAALSIEGETRVVYDAPVTLTVNGGQLGTAASWAWYEKSCGGKRLGEGESIVVVPTDNTTYFVRAEGHDTTKCIQKTVYIISQQPDFVTGGGDIKVDEQAVLRISGGSLAPQAKWVWYENACGGKSIGQGKSLTVSPTGSTTYYVRAEGKNNTTECVSVVVSMLPRDPTAITGPSFLQIGQVAKLAVEGGYLGDGDQWAWYEGNCGGKKIATGDQVSVTPIENATYFVRSEGKHPATRCASFAIQPQPLSSYAQLGTSPYIDNVKWSYDNGKVRLSYKIRNSRPSDRYNLAIKAFRNSGDLAIGSPSNNLRGRGQKVVSWDAAQNGFSPNDRVVFNISGTVYQKIPLVPKLAKSLIFPGWGDIHLRNSSSRLWLGVLGYTCAAASIYLNRRANQNYESYKHASDISSRNQLYQNVNTQNYASFGCAAVACCCWTTDIVGVISRHHKVKKDPANAISRYYSDRSQHVINKFTDPSTVKPN